VPAVEQLNPDQHVRDRQLKADELDPLARQPVWPRVDRPPLHQRIRQLLDGGLRHVADVLRDA
jgi:hypothetical protein